MDTTLVDMVRLRQHIMDNQKMVKDLRAQLKSMIEQVQQYMSDTNVQTITDVDGEYTVTLATSQRMPSMSMDFVHACLSRYWTEAGPGANAADAASYVFAQRKEHKETVKRLQVRRKKTTTTTKLKLAATTHSHQQEEDDDDDYTQTEDDEQQEDEDESLGEFQL
jgi:hypothetical protein